ALEPATADVAVRDDPQVAHLAGYAVRTPVDLPAQHDSTADPGADGQQHHVVDVLGGAASELPPRGGVRVVLDDRGQPGRLGDLIANVHVAPSEIRREHDLGPPGVDEAGRPDAHGVHLMAVGEVVDHRDDGRHDRRRVLGRSRAAYSLTDDPLLVDHPCSDLRAADIDADGQAHSGSPYWSRRSATRLSSSFSAVSMITFSALRFIMPSIGMATSTVNW